MLMSCLSDSDTGSSSSEDEGPNRLTSGSSARNGEVRRRRSRTPSPRRRHRDVSPRSDILSKWLNFILWTMFCIVHVYYGLWLNSFRKRRSPSPGRRRRSPSPPRRRRSPSPRRRYLHISWAIVCVNWNFERCVVCLGFFDEWIWISQVSFSTSPSSFSIPQAIFSPYPASLQPFPFAATEEENVQLSP